MSLSLSQLRRRHILLALLLVFLPCTFFILLSSPDMSGEEVLVERLAELQLRLQHLDAMYRAREENVQILSQHLSQLLTDSYNISGIPPEARYLIGNTTGNVHPLRLPSAYHFLPHLLLNPASLRPAYSLSKGRNGVSVIMGVPTVKREVQSYLLSTLQNLIQSMSKAEQDDAIIVVLIAETDEEYVLQVATELKEHFEIELHSGLLEVIAPPLSYYPDMNKLRTTLGDAPERVRWRTKQNLDFAFLMMYAQPKAMFYIQLEDDILAKPHFVTTMKSVALERITNKKPWFVLDFCQLGFIGKMFRCVELPWLIQFFFMFYNDKPVDWLLDHLIHTKSCNLDKDTKHCKKAKDELWIHYKPSLFQHIGTHSSLKGKVQKLKDKQFGKVRLYSPHSNPEANVISEIKAYKQYTLKRAYLGESFFWGLLPQPGDHLFFKFNNPINIKRYMFRSGNLEHPLDRFYNTTVEVLPLASPTVNYDTYNLTTDGFIVIGKFDNMGLAEGKMDPRLGPLKEIRLTVHSESVNWAILSEILIEPEQSR
ncbi:alpha-1,3-mannosyl-glycoprotein 4-beta-N-acetylglucosaminyltransferase B [Cimex lectularius]|uniref:Alpha-1,3-mannosyl-glycoprotein 4-beta-N-acetylglucosaminyltransferase B n=1 Tax=Cimex lectularius TaxID=79782 RepID=A0A8I6RGB2_CIMLE|nr:alpha-1,3-mannosyl-glycoprotein 4-beta-N-acetylglucosaminyltransferase B [Cimex lectularius]XP_014242790.1 alpha-1,3-mannosyl-glycoprotein 4-beta-N-acetylglucosaminyltransferase B [Cimex lectularius]